MKTLKYVCQVGQSDAWSLVVDLDYAALGIAEDAHFYGRGRGSMAKRIVDEVREEAA